MRVMLLAAAAGTRRTLSLDALRSRRLNEFQRALRRTRTARTRAKHATTLLRLPPAVRLGRFTFSRHRCSGVGARKCVETETKTTRLETCQAQ